MEVLSFVSDFLALSNKNSAIFCAESFLSAEYVSFACIPLKISKVVMTESYLDYNGTQASKQAYYLENELTCLLCTDDVPQTVTVLQKFMVKIHISGY